MAKIRSMAALEKELQKRIFAASASLSKEAKKDLAESVQSEVYNKSKPKYYKRTGDLKKSISSDTYQVGSSTKIKIYHDIAKFKQIAPTSRYTMGTHHSTVKNYFPQEYAYFIPVTVEQGTSGKIFGDGAWTKPRRYFEPVKNKWINTFKDKLKQELIRRKLNIK